MASSKSASIEPRRSYCMSRLMIASDCFPGVGRGWYGDAASAGNGYCSPKRRSSGGDAPGRRHQSDKQCVQPTPRAKRFVRYRLRPPDPKLASPGWRAPARTVPCAAVGIPHGVSTVVTREVWCSYCVDGNLSAGTADRGVSPGDDRPDRPAFYRDLEGNGVDRL